MDQASHAIFQMTILLIITAVGFLAAKLGYLDAHTKTKITDLLLNITLPCMIIASVGNVDVALLGPQLPLMLAFGAGEFFLWLAIAYLFIAIFRVPKSQRSVYCFMSVLTNTSFVGIPVASALYGESAALLCSVFIMATSTLIYSIGVGILVSDKEEQPKYNNQANASKSNRVTQVLRAVLSPLIIAAVLALILVFSQVQLPSILQESLSTIGGLTAPLAMMLVGVIISQESLREVVSEWHLYPFILLRQLIAPALSCLVLRMFISDPVLLGIFVVMFALPVGSMCSMFCASYGKDAVLPAKGTILSTISSFVIIPLLLMFIAVV